MVSRGPTQVAVEYSVAAGCFLVAYWCHALIVDMVVSSYIVRISGGLVASHAHIGCVAEL